MKFELVTDKDIIRTSRKLTDMERLKLKAELYERYTGKKYVCPPLKPRLYLPIEPKGFLMTFFNR